MSHMDHPIKATRVTVLQFMDCRPSEIHAAGCAHEAKAKAVFQCKTVPSADDGYDDDWMHVAPCARKAPKEAS